VLAFDETSGAWAIEEHQEPTEILPNNMIYEKLAPFEYLEFVAGLWELPSAPAEGRARELIDRLGLGRDGVVVGARCGSSGPG